MFHSLVGVDEIHRSGKWLTAGKLKAGIINDV